MDRAKIIFLCRVQCAGHRAIDSYLLVCVVIKFPTSFQIAKAVFPSAYNRGLFSKNTNPTKQGSFIFYDSNKAWVATVFCVPRTHLARPEISAHAHVCAPSFYDGHTLHPHPHFFLKINFKCHFM